MTHPDSHLFVLDSQSYTQYSLRFILDKTFFVPFHLQTMRERLDQIPNGQANVMAFLVQYWVHELGILGNAP